VNAAKYNQQRVSSVRYLGELYNYRMVESQVIFRTLYSFITFGSTFDGNDIYYQLSVFYTNHSYSNIDNNSNTQLCHTCLYRPCSLVIYRGQIALFQHCETWTG